MKSFLFVTLLFFAFTVNAQDSVKVKAPRISIQQQLNVPILVNDISVKLVKVINDSRCPKGVNCIRAGEAKVIVEITEAGKTPRMKEVVIQAAVHPDYYSLIVENKSSKIYAVDLLPYPVYKEKTEAKDYIFKVEVR